MSAAGTANAVLEPQQSGQRKRCVRVSDITPQSRVKTVEPALPTGQSNHSFQGMRRSGWTGLSGEQVDTDTGISPVSLVN